MSRRLPPPACHAALPSPPTVAALLRLPLLLIGLIGLLGSGIALAYTDRLVNRGVVWGAAQTPIPAADGNPMGINVFLEKESDQDVRHTLRVARDGGFRWIRQSFLWNDLEIDGKGDFTDRRDPTKPPHSAWDKYDLIVDQAAANGLTILARLDAPPQWAQLCPTVDHSAPAHNSDYADFVRAVVSRYQGKIRYFQIWNEPNLRGEWTTKLNGQCVQQPNAAEYTALLKAAYEAAHAANPAVVILMAPLAQTVETGPANLSDLLYLQAMYDAGAKPYFDVASVMAYGLGQGPDERRAEPQRINFARPVLTREIMERNGDSAKAVWASEVAWMSLPPDWTGAPGIWGTVAEATQADYLVAAFQRARAEWPWMGPMFVWHLQADPTALPGDQQPYFAILNPDWTPRPAFTALQRYSKRFPIADTGAERADNPALTTTGPWQPVVLGGQPVATASDPTASATLTFQGTGLDLLFVPDSTATRVQLTIDGTLPPNWPRDPTGQAVIALPARGSTTDRVQPDRSWPAPPGESALRVHVAEGLPFGPHTAGLRPASVSGAVRLVGYVVSRDSPWRAAFPLGYGILSILGLGFALASGRAAWGYPRLVRAALTQRGVAGDALWAGLAAVALALVLAAYYFSPWQKGALLAFAVWWLLAVWRPDMALVITAATIPFFWAARPLAVGGFSGNIALSESCLWATLAAWAAQRAWRARAARRKTVLPTPPADVTLTGYLQLYQALQGPAPWRERLALVWRRDLFGPPALALLAVATCSLLTVANPDYIKDSLHAYRWTIVEPLLFYFLATAIRPGRRQALRLADGFVAGATLAAGLALVGGLANLPGYTLVVQGVTRFQGVFPHPDNLGLFLGRAAAFAAALALFLHPPAERLRRIFYALATALMLPALLLSYSRGAWLAVAVAGGVLALTAGRRWALAYGGLALLTGAALVSAALLGRLAERITHLGSSLVRLDLWRAALHIGRAHPIFGIGLDQFLNQHQQYLIDMHIQLDAEHIAESWLSHPHNLILDWWLSLGIMGVLVAGWIAVRALRGALVLSRRTDARTAALARAALAGLTVAAIHGLVDNAYFLGDLALTCWLFAALLQLLWKTAPDRNRITRKLDFNTETRRRSNE